MIRRWFLERPVIVLATVAFGVQFVDMILIVVGLSIFLDQAGASAMPAFYVVCNVIAVVIKLVLLARGHVSSLAMVRWMTLGLAVVLLACVPVLDGGARVVCFLLFLVIRLHDIHALTYFATYTQSVFPVRDAKSAMAVILGAGSVASVAGGLVVRPLVAVVSVTGLLAGVAVLALGVTLALAAVEALWPPPPAGTSQERGMGRLSRALNEVRAEPLASTVVHAWLLYTFMRYLVDFQYTRALSSLFPEPAAMAAFVGPFQAGVSFVVVVGQFLIARRLLERFRPGGTMGISSALQALVCVAVALYPHPVLVVALQALWTTGFHMATRPAINVLLVPLEGERRERAALVVSLAGSLAALGSGAVLVLFAPVVPVGLYFALLAGMSVAYLASTRRLDGAYLATVERRVRSQDRRERLEVFDSLGYLGSGREREHLARLMEDCDAAVRLRAVRRLGVLSARDGAALALAALERERDSRVLAALVRALPELLGEDTVAALQRVLSASEDPRVRATALETLGHVGGPGAAASAASYLSSSHHRVRASAVAALLRASEGFDGLERGLTVLADMARDPVPFMRAAAAATAGELGYGCFVPYLLSATNDGEAAVRRVASRSLARLRAAEALPRLRELAREDPDPEVRGSAAGAARVVEARAVDDVTRLAGRLTDGERGALARFLRDAGGGARVAASSALLRLGFPPGSGEMLEVLRVLDEDDEAARAAVAGLEGDDLEALPLLLLRRPADRVGGPARALTAVVRVLGDEAAVAAAIACLRRLALAHLAGLGGLEERLLARTALVVARAAGEEGDGGPVRRAVEEASGSDAHVASLALELLESRCSRPLFALLLGFLEARRRPGGQDAHAREMVDEWSPTDETVEAALAGLADDAQRAAVRAVVTRKDRP